MHISKQIVVPVLVMVAGLGVFVGAQTKAPAMAKSKKMTVSFV